MILKSCNFLKKTFQHRCFPVNIARFCSKMMSWTSLKYFIGYLFCSILLELYGTFGKNHAWTNRKQLTEINEKESKLSSKFSKNKSSPKQLKNTSDVLSSIMLIISRWHQLFLQCIDFHYRNKNHKLQSIS